MDQNAVLSHNFQIHMMMVIFLFSGLAVLSLLPETSFCFFRGNCRQKVGRGRFYDSYKQHWRNQQQQQQQGGEQHRRRPNDYYYDYYGYDEPEFLKKTGLENAKLTRPKRDTAAYEDYDFEQDVSTFPAEHRAAQSKRAKNPM